MAGLSSVRRVCRLSPVQQNGPIDIPWTGTLWIAPAVLLVPESKY